MHITLRQLEVFAEVLKVARQPVPCHAVIVAIRSERSAD